MRGDSLLIGARFLRADVSRVTEDKKSRRVANNFEWILIRAIIGTSMNDHLVQNLNLLRFPVEIERIAQRTRQTFEPGDKRNDRADEVEQRPPEQTSRYIEADPMRNPFVVVGGSLAA
jgi:hypothetical protein